MILVLLKLWMSSKVLPMDMDPPSPCPIKPTMIYLSIPVLGMTKLKMANIFYNTNIDDTDGDHPTACIDHVPDSPYGGIELPPDDFYEVHTLSSRHPPSRRPGNPSRPSFRPQSQNSVPTKPIRRYDGPIFLPPQIYKLLSQDAMNALKAYNTEAINRFHPRKVHNTKIVETPQNDFPEPPVPENDPVTFLKVT